jgi:hypothetical protein
MATHLTKLSSWMLVQELDTTYENGNSPYQAQLMGGLCKNLLPPTKMATHLTKLSSWVLDEVWFWFLSRI